MGKYFGTDGVRGVANSELSPELALKLGRYGAYVLSQHAEVEEGRPLVLVGRDTRRSGTMLEDALVAGLVSSGVDVMLLGEITTPGLAYLIRFQQAAGGIMITASHNPATDNGIKFIGSNGYKLSDDQEEEIEVLLDSSSDDLPRPNSTGLGIVDDYREGSSKYIQFLTQSIEGDLSGLKVVLDGANGAASDLLARLFADLETDRFEVIGASPDGLNINEGYGSTHPEKLAEKVVELEADAGLAFDGDGDRVIAVDEKGEIVNGDHIMFIIAKNLNDKQMLKKDTVVSTVMSNLGFYKALEAEGIHSVQTKVGDRFVVEEMRKNSYNFGGEQSGHIVFNDLHTTGDGLLTGVQLLYVLKESGQTLSELSAGMEDFPQKLINVRVRDKHQALNNEKVNESIAEVEEQLGSDGRVLVRPSGTEPVLRVMVEAATEEASVNFAQHIADVVDQEMGVEGQEE